MTDEVKHARGRVARAASNSLTAQDRLELSTVSTKCRNDHEGAVFLLEKALERKREYDRTESTRQMDLFSQGMICPTGKDTTVAANDIVRGSLFGALKPGPRNITMRITVLDWDDIQMFYEGVRLSQSDLDVLLAITRRIQENTSHGFGNEMVTAKESDRTRIRCTSRGMLNDLGRSTGGMDHKWLRRCLSRLHGIIEVKRRSLKGGWSIISTTIVHKWAFDDDTKELIIDVNHDFIRLMEGGYTKINWQNRLKLSPFGKWLQGMVLSHREGDTKLRTTDQLMKAYGSKASRPDRFLRETITPALASLKQYGEVEHYRIEGHMIWWKTPAP